DRHRGPVGGRGRLVVGAGGGVEAPAVIQLRVDVLQEVGGGNRRVLRVDGPVDRAERCLDPDEDIALFRVLRVCEGGAGDGHGASDRADYSGGVPHAEEITRFSLDGYRTGLRRQSRHECHRSSQSRESHFPLSKTTSAPEIDAAPVSEYATMNRTFALSLLIAAAFAAGGAQSGSVTSDALKGMALRSIGPDITTGRISDIDIDPKNPNVWYVASASGGLFKTENRGNNFTAIFDTGGSFSLGAVKVDPKDSNVVWLGTGENNNQRSVAFGDGVYKSTDAGKTWKRM